MYLKEFDLDLPFFENKEEAEKIANERNCDYYEACRYLYEKNWSEKRLKFILETRCISSYYERLFKEKSYKIKNIWKILIDCVEKVNDNRIIEIEGVLSVQVEFDYNHYFNCIEHDKKKIILDTLMNGIENIVKSKNFNIEPFIEVRNEIMESKFINTYSWMKPVKNQNKEFAAEIILEHELEIINFYILIKNKDNEIILHEKILSQKPDEWFFKKYLGSLLWKSSNEIELLSKNGDSVYSCKIKS